MDPAVVLRAEWHWVKLPGLALRNRRQEPYRLAEGKILYYITVSN